MGLSEHSGLFVRCGIYFVVLGLIVFGLIQAQEMHLGGFIESPEVRKSHSTRELYRAAYGACHQLVKSKKCAPLLVRLAWHDSGNYDVNTKTGGANGSIRFEKELGHNGNAGIPNGIALLKPIKDRYPEMTYADLFQMASAAAIDVSGGPKIDMIYGRVDSQSDAEVPPNGRLPGAAAPFHKAVGDDPTELSDMTAAEHLRAVFYRMGLEDVDIVALSGAHTLGRAYKDRSGACPMAKTQYTENGPGTLGGMSWTREWLKFDNSYFKGLVEAEKGAGDAELLVLETDRALLEDPAFRPHTERFAADQEAFFAQYAVSHKKLSELGARFDPHNGISIAGTRGIGGRVVDATY
mmetsp:Transcript_28733/g.62947  ORF Transcript_28733/g.62947 Transcript_28733/m.62947 type:complete len:351 (-) Transcript_28733:715-1767(-)|eukprot:CAMPEP_0118929508 /NCGR_PEP_ID=MMETSP1169-20130426/6492_1 /TAXON_ID=36882 /ORGANISM="Pyramimonas obovata, Strain CCMP722" /LENGTH=350 /DNA_ID=CAMNT_0006871713 /DNA_START=52 /DNA_END=1104 /DNA_ORIENTATION=-